ncbi:MAG TPA: YggS family pyridoxal phosphate enzyme [Acidimicrobiales bacterium]|nr:YggS family pyridoxal phosphate enzyme [Acidimicrobiales bacterium]
MTTSPASCASDELLERLRANLARVRERISASGRELSSVRLVAVTKTFGLVEVRAAYELGLRTFAENYVDELCAKAEATRDLGVTWHYLGALQTNKIVRAARCADVLSSAARERELAKIAAASPGMAIDVQVDFTRDARRNGVAPSDVAQLVTQARALALRVRGLMVVAPPGEAPTRKAFAATVALADELGLVERSMGMSDDLELACELGTTEVRLGRALFGPRVG